MRSWERAKPLSRPDVSLVIGGGWKFIVPDMFPCALGRRIGIKYPRLIFSIFDPVLCIVGRFACQVPFFSATRTAIPERFFGRKITAGNFMSRKPEA